MRPFNRKKGLFSTGQRCLWQNNDRFTEAPGLPCLYSFIYFSPLYSAHPLFLKPAQCLTWLTNAQGRFRKESSRSSPLKDWMPLVSEHCSVVIVTAMDRTASGGSPCNTKCHTEPSVSLYARLTIGHEKGGQWRSCSADPFRGDPRGYPGYILGTNKSRPDVENKEGGCNDWTEVQLMSRSHRVFRGSW